MLVLTRQLGEKLKIGENITVSVVAIKGNQVRIGIDAPRHIQVDREECIAPDQADLELVYRQACM